MDVCVLGLGEVGLPTAKYVLEKGFDVWGYDISVEVVETAIREGVKNSTVEWDEVPRMDAYIVCVSTTFRENSPNFAAIHDVCEKISLKAKASSLVSIESTLMPGVSRKIFREIFEEKICLVHVPHRYYKMEPDDHGVRQLRVIGGVTPNSLGRGLKLYETLHIPLYAVSSIEVAEMSKISENAYRYLQIAYAEELRMICDEIGLSFEEVRDACNTKWNIELLEARDGIGGHCLPKDVKYLAHLTGHNELIKSAMDVDEKYRKWLRKSL
jgi:UDP-N-acetyl-D-mannosaminuronic acid dehydrogenase